MLIPTGRLRPQQFVAAGRPCQPDGEEPGEQPDPAPSGHDDPTNEVMLRDHRGRLRLPAYILIALVTAFAAIVVLTVAVLIAPR